MCPVHTARFEELPRPFPPARVSYLKGQGRQMLRPDDPHRDTFIFKRSRRGHGIFGERIVRGKKLNRNAVNENVLGFNGELTRTSPRIDAFQGFQDRTCRGRQQNEDINVVGSRGLRIEQRGSRPAECVISQYALSLQLIECVEDLTKSRHDVRRRTIVGGIDQLFPPTLDVARPSRLKRNGSAGCTSSSTAAPNSPDTYCARVFSTSSTTQSASAAGEITRT